MTCPLCDGSGVFTGLVDALTLHGCYDSAHESMKDTVCRCCGGKGIIDGTDQRLVEASVWYWFQGDWKLANRFDYGLRELRDLIIKSGYVARIACNKPVSFPTQLELKEAM